MASNIELCGLEYQNQMIIMKDEKYVEIYLGKWADQVFTDNPDLATNVDADGVVQQIDLTGPNMSEYKLWGADQMGLCYLRPVLSVQRLDLRKLPAGSFQILRFVLRNGSTFACGPDTPFVTRFDNILQWKLARDMPEGSYVAESLKNFIVYPEPKGPVLAALGVQDYMDVPNIITGTWGEIPVLTRGECAAGYLACIENPESVDPGDAAVFDAILTEQVEYDPITRVTDVTSEYLAKQKYLYWIDTDYHNFSSYQTCFLTGKPVPGPVFKPLHASKPQEEKPNIEENKAKFQADVEKLSKK